MNVWIVFAGETLPMDEATRTWRYGMLAETLVARGHHVTRWAPTFNHSHKKQRYHTDYTYQVNENYKIELIYNRGYKRNVGFQRLLSYIQLASSFQRRIKNEKPPDIIISGMPTPWLCSAAIKYGQHKHIPVVIDIRDLWPDIFIDVFPKYLNNIGKLVLDILFAGNKDIFEKASSITAISSKYLEWGLNYANRAKTENDRIFYMGYKQKPLTDQMNVDLYEFWKKLGVSKQHFICCFFGSTNRQFNIDTVIHAAKHFKEIKRNEVLFVICGDGTHLSYYKDVAKECNNIVFPGWVGPEQIQSLMQISEVGLAPYSSGAKMSLPNKPFEYFSGGLPVISSLRGELEQILSENDCGLTYEAGDVRGLVDAILDLKNNSEKREQMGKNARCLFEKEYSSDKIYPVMADYMERLVYGNDKKR